jgi:hypothetical protein
MNVSLIEGIFGEDTSMTTAPGSAGTMDFMRKGGVEREMLVMDLGRKGEVLDGGIEGSRRLDAGCGCMIIGAVRVFLGVLVESKSLSRGTVLRLGPMVGT